LFSSDLQLGFKKHLGCGPALFSAQQVVKYFTSRGSTVFITAVDASKAFDRLDHTILLDKLISRKLPACFIKVISCWYSKLYSSVRWNSYIGAQFKVLSGVRQGGILSPILFNMYVDDLIEALKANGDGCHVRNCYIGCIMYADDLLLLSPSVTGLQRMLDICSAYSVTHKILFNPSKTVGVVIGPSKIASAPLVYIDKHPIPWVEQFKYLGVVFNAGRVLSVDPMSVTRKFYAALNSLLGKCCNCAEPVQVELVKSYCLPLLSYCLGALELNCSAIRDLAVAWNNAFRRIFHYNRWESVKQLQYFCGCLDFKHLYDLARYRFLSDISNRLVYLSGFFTSLEFHYHSVTMLHFVMQVIVAC